MSQCPLSSVEGSSSAWSAKEREAAHVDPAPERIDELIPGEGAGCRGEQNQDEVRAGVRD